MVIVLQLIIFATVMLVRELGLKGIGITVISKGSRRLWSKASGRYGQVYSLTIGLNRTNTGLPFAVRKERWYHRLLKALHLASEVDVADPDFGRSHFFVTDDPEHLEQALHNGPLLAALQELFALPVKALYASPTRLWCTIKSADLKKPQSHFETHYALLEKIDALTVTSTANGPIQRRARHRRNLAFLFLSLHSSLLALGLLGGPTLLLAGGSVDITQEGQWGSYVVLATLLAVPLWMGLIVALFKKTSWICWVMADFMLWGILGIILSSIFIIRDANIYLPQPPATTITMPVLAKACTLHCSQSCGRRCTKRREFVLANDAECTPQSRATLLAEAQRNEPICTHTTRFDMKIFLMNWRPLRNDPQGSAYYTFDATPGQFDAAHIGQGLHLPLHPGALGIEWLDTTDIYP